MADWWCAFLRRPTAAVRGVLAVLSVVLLLPACSAFASLGHGAPDDAPGLAQDSVMAGLAEHHRDAQADRVCARASSAIAPDATRTAGRGAPVLSAQVMPAYASTPQFPALPSAVADQQPRTASYYLRTSRILR